MNKIVQFPSSVAAVVPTASELEQGGRPTPPNFTYVMCCGNCAHSKGMGPGKDYYCVKYKCFEVWFGRCDDWGIAR